MNLSHLTGVLLIIIGLGLAACAGNTATEVSETSPAGTGLAAEEATLEPGSPTPQPIFTATPTPEPTSSPEPSTTPTPVPTFTSIPTPIPEAKAKISDKLTTPINMRAGPGTNYPVVGQFEPGMEAKVTGRNEDSSWWQVDFAGNESSTARGWVFGELVSVSHSENIPIAEVPPTPLPPTPAPEVVESKPADENPNAETLADQLRCGKDFCVTYQAMLSMAENGGCIGNHSIYVTVLQGPPPGVPMDNVVIGDTFNNVEMLTGSHGPGRTELTLWMNSMILIAKRHADGTPYTSEESFNFTSHDELIPAEVLAANGYCGGTVQQCERDRNQNSVCRGHYSWRVTFHKFD